VADAGLVEHPREGQRAIARTVVGEHPLDDDASVGEEAKGSDHERRGSLLPFVGEDLGVGKAGTIIDRGVDEVVALTSKPSGPSPSIPAVDPPPSPGILPCFFTSTCTSSPGRSRS